MFRSKIDIVNILFLDIEGINDNKLIYNPIHAPNRNML